MKPQKQKKKPVQSRELTPQRKRLFLAITVATPFLVFIFLELALRLIHYGPNLSLFTTEKIGGNEYYIMNTSVKNRYFHHVDFSPNTSPDFFPVQKEPGTFRIFCLGGSTTVGYPYGYVGSFSTFLRDRLNALFPEKRFEIINLGMTATNSFTALDIARELPEYQPDLVIVYDGHNEFYGALGAASHESTGGSRGLTLLYLRLVHFKTFSLMRDIAGRISGLFASSSTGDSGTMMERLAKGQYVPYGSDLYREGLETFRSNVEALRDIFRQHNIPLILSTQASNLRGQSPFVSTPLGEIPQSLRDNFNAAFNAGMTEWMEGRTDSSAKLFRNALALDTTYAEAHYRLAHCLDSLKDKHSARLEYIKARDYDHLRFRMSGDFNDMLRQLDDGRAVRVADIENVFASSSPDSIIGNELILEHLHPNSRGYFLMGKAYANAIRSMGLVASADAWKKADTLNDDSLWQSKPMTDLDMWCAKRRTDLLTSGWPFKPQTSTPKQINTTDPLAEIGERVVTGKISWEEGHVAAADYYKASGQTEKAVREYRTLINQFPFNVSAFLLLGQLYMKEARLDDAREVFVRSLAVERTYYAYRSIGGILLEKGKPLEAAGYLDKAFGMGQSPNDRLEAGYLLAVAYHRTGNAIQARSVLQQVLKINPQFKPALILLRRIGT